MTSKKKLTEKQKLFCKNYLKEYNATKSAISAGYSKKTAYSIGNELLKKPEIAEYLQKQTEKRAEKVDLSVEMILSDLIELKNRCMQKTEVLDREGNPTGEWKFDATAANKSLELLGKHLAMWTEKIEAKVEVNTFAQIALKAAEAEK